MTTVCSNDADLMRVVSLKRIEIPFSARQVSSWQRSSVVDSVSSASGGPQYNHELHTNVVFFSVVINMMATAHSKTER